MTVLYTAKAHAAGGREGHAATDDGALDLTFVAPGSGKPGTNPEQLFACGYAACFIGAVAFVARTKGAAITGEITLDSAVSLHKGDDGFKISATLDVTVPGLTPTDAVALVREAHTVCPYSKATKGNVDVALTANGAPV